MRLDDQLVSYIYVYCICPACRLGLGFELHGSMTDEQITYSLSTLSALGGGRLGGKDWTTDEWYPWLRFDFGTLYAVTGVRLDTCSTGGFVSSVWMKRMAKTTQRCLISTQMTVLRSKTGTVQIPGFV